MKKRFPALFLLVWIISQPSEGATAIDITVLKDGKTVSQGTGASIAKETIITSAQLVADGNQIQVQDKQSGAKLVGEILATSEKEGLAIVSVKGLQTVPLTLAKAPLDAGRTVSLLGRAGNQYSGVVNSILEEDGVGKLKHTALFGDGDFGAPVLNNCGELAGVSETDRSGIFGSKLVPPTSMAVAASQATLKTFLDTHKVNYSIAENVCLSESEQLDKLARENKEKDDAVARADEENAKNAEIIKTLEEKSKRQTEELKNVKTSKQQVEKTVKDIEAQKQEKEEALKKAEQENQRSAEKVDELNKIRQKQEDKKRHIYYAGAGILAIFGLIFIVAFAKIRLRKQEVAELQQRNLAGEQVLKQEKAKADDMQEQIKKASATFKDLAFSGHNEDGVEHRFKVPGSTLARSQSGLIVGRSVQNANIVLNVSGVSREHLRLSLVDGKVLVEDVGSSNGTILNGKRLEANEKFEITQGAELKIGTVSGRIFFMK